MPTPSAPAPAHASPVSSQTMLVVMLAVAAIQPDPSNPRTVKDDENSRDLALDLKKRGVLAPLLVRKNGDVYVLIDGHRRLAAARVAGLERVPCVVFDKGVTEEEVREAQLVTSLHSQALSPFEVYKGAKNWLALHPGATTAKDLAAAISRSEGYVSMVLSLDRCIAPVQEAAREGKISLKDWYTMSSADSDLQGTMLASRLNGASREELESRKRQGRNEGKPKETTSRIKVEVASGITVSFTAKDAFDLDQAIKAANEAAKLMKEGQVKGLTLKNIQKGSADKAKAG